MSHKLVAIVGPTASGKTTLAIKLAKKYNGQIVCADSRTIYRGIDIGTAKPTQAEQKQVKHYLLDIVKPNEDFNAKRFKEMAQAAIDNIWRKGKLPFLVGGSGMYIDAVLFGYQFRHPRLYPDQNLDDKSLDELIAIAQKKYPKSIKEIDIKNRRRVEQLILKGPAKDDDRRKLELNALIIGLCPDTTLLKEKIALRTDEILRLGFVDEVKKLRSTYGNDTVALQTTGYSAVSQYLDGKLGEVQLRQAIIKQTFELAKKQITWFKRNKYVQWVKNNQEAEELLRRYVDKKSVK